MPTIITSIQHITETHRVIRQEKEKRYLNQKRSKIISACLSHDYICRKSKAPSAKKVIKLNK